MGAPASVSICTRRLSAGPAGSSRRASPLEREIARLQGENAALKKDLLARNLPLPGSIKPDPPAPAVEPRLQLPDDADLDKVLNFIEKVWRRLVEMIVRPAEGRDEENHDRCAPRRRRRSPPVRDHPADA